jgi:endonuclease-3
VAPLEQLLDRLRQFYGLLPAPPADPFIFFVWEVLSTHSTPAGRDAALTALKALRALTPDAMWRTPHKKLEDAVKGAGDAEDRIRSLKTGVDLFRRTPNLPSQIRGPLPAARRALKALPQLGDGGAHRMLLFAAGHAVLPMDARVHRVGRRLGYGGATDFGKSRRSVQHALTAGLSKDVGSFRRAFLYLSHHGATTCGERDPHCGICPLLEHCPEGGRRQPRPTGNLS